VGPLDSINESNVGLIYTKKPQYNGLFEHCRVFQNGFAPYLLGDKKYPLLSSTMTPYKEGQHFVIELFYNKIHHFMMDNVFGILNKTF
jgi:hypothetical protein